MKKFDKDKDQKFSKKEVKNILAKTCWWMNYHFQLIAVTDSDTTIIFNEINWGFLALMNLSFFQVSSLLHLYSFNRFSQFNI